jgi:hypothetical protein
LESWREMISGVDMAGDLVYRCWLTWVCLYIAVNFVSEWVSEAVSEWVMMLEEVSLQKRKVEVDEILLWKSGLLRFNILVCALLRYKEPPFWLQQSHGVSYAKGKQLIKFMYCLYNFIN